MEPRQFRDQAVLRPVSTEHCNKAFRMERTFTVLKLTCLLLLLLGYSTARRDQIPGERLINDLLGLQNYEPLVRPAHNQSETVHVRHGFNLITLNVKEGDKRGEVDVETGGWFSMSWEDFRLRWNPKAYSGTNSLKLSSSKIWTPDITVYDSFLPSQDRDYGYLLHVDFSGSVTWVPKQTLKHTCESVSKGVYYCRWKFGSWTYSGYDLDLYPADGKINLDDYKINVGWDVLNTTCTRHVSHYSCCPEPYISLDYGITIQKRKDADDKPKRYRSGLFGRIIDDDEDIEYEDSVLPALLLPTVIISLLVPFQFLVPPESCQRICVLTILLVALVGVFFITHATETSASDSSLDLDFFYNISIVWVFSALLLSIFTLHVSRWGQIRSKLPDLLRKIFLVGLGKLVCITCNTGYNVASANVPMDLVDEKHDTEKGSRLEEQMAALLNVVRGLSNYLTEVKDNQNEWYLLALVVDRLHCIVYLIVFIILACITLA